MSVFEIIENALSIDLNTILAVSLVSPSDTLFFNRICNKMARK